MINARNSGSTHNLKNVFEVTRWINKKKIHRVTFTLSDNYQNVKN